MAAESPYDRGQWAGSFVSAPALGQVDVIRVDDTQMAGEGVVPAERLLLGAQRTVHLLLAGIVDRVLVPGQIVRPREDGVARLARRWVDALALCQVSTWNQSKRERARSRVRLRF